MSATSTIVAIDGPAGAGKSTIAKALAKRLELDYLDTGAMYRAVTHAAIERGVPLDDAVAVGEVARGITILVTDGRTCVDGVDVSDLIRGTIVTSGVSTVAANSEVRRVMRDLQRAWGDERPGGVIEGRDIGTIVFPDATLKVYLTASPRVRAQRRVGQVGGDLEETERSIVERDHKDSSRSDSPLVTSADSVVVDTSDRSVDEVVEEIVTLVEGRHGSERA